MYIYIYICIHHTCMMMSSCIMCCLVCIYSNYGCEFPMWPKGQVEALSTHQAATQSIPRKVSWVARLSAEKVLSAYVWAGTLQKNLGAHTTLWQNPSQIPAKNPWKLASWEVHTLLPLLLCDVVDCAVQELFNCLQPGESLDSGDTGVECTELDPTIQ